MAAVVHLDTHVVVWLYVGDRKRLGPVERHMQGRRLVVSPMVLVELEFLHEIGRITARAHQIVGQLNQSVELTVSAFPFLDVAKVALELAWTRDPFDRLIAAQAMAEGVPLLSADERLRAHCPWALWG